MLKWLNSVRAIVVVLVTLAVIGGLFAGKVSNELFGQISMLVIGAYFAKRDENKDR